MLPLALTASLLYGQAVLPMPAPVPEGPSRPLRVGLSASAGTLGGGAAMGLVALLSMNSTGFDSTFTTAALVSVMTSGVGFAIHTALGGKGEVILGFLAAVPWVVGVTGILFAADVSPSLRPLLVGAIASLPAAASAVAVLELTQPRDKRPVQLQVSPGGLSGRF